MPRGQKGEEHFKLRGKSKMPDVGMCLLCSGGRVAGAEWKMWGNSIWGTLANQRRPNCIGPYDFYSEMESLEGFKYRWDKSNLPSKKNWLLYWKQTEVWKVGSWDATIIYQVRVYGGLDQGSSSRDGEKWLNSEYILRVKKICEWITFRVWEKDVKDNSNTFGLSN